VSDVLVLGGKTKEFQAEIDLTRMRAHVISGKSKLEFLISDFSGIAHSRISTIRMWAVPIPVTVRPKSSMVSALPVQEPIGASHVSISIARAPVGRSNPRDPQEE
jgi:hypothetical protein